MIIKLLVDGGDMKPGPAIAQKLGPLGINIGKVIEETNKATLSFRGIKVPVTLDVNTKTKSFSIEVLTPPVAELLKKEISVDKGSGTPNKIKIANVALEQIVNVTKAKQKGMLAKNFKLALKSVLGSCISLGIIVENKDPREIIKELDKNKEFKEIIEKQKTEVSEEKKKQLESYFNRIKAKQDELLKKEAEEAAAKEAEKAAAAPAVAAATEAKVAAPIATTAPKETAKKEAKK
ncbi:50S ribosomal protein L11 [Candidatus Pacearchaeota archaeon]|nr:50S ribosomal protein L11 [Candidatus Pacearchaeota archaeon]